MSDPSRGSASVERSVGAPDWPESSAAESSPSRRRVRKESSPWRRKTIRVGTDDELGVTTLVELHCAIPVGAVRGDAAQRRERFGGGMTIPVLSADGDHGRARTDRIDKWDRVRAGGAVVRRYVHACGEGHRAQKKVGLRLLGSVAHEEHREGASLKTYHERGHVHAWVAVRREDRERRIADMHPHPGGDGTPRHLRTPDAVVPSGGDRARVQANRFDRETHFVSFEHTNETVGMIGVRVRERDQVDPARPRWQARAELGEKTRRVRPSVDEDRSTVELDEERVALADIQRAHTDPGRRWPQKRGRARDEDDDPNNGARRECQTREPRSRSQANARGTRESDPPGDSSREP